MSERVALTAAPRAGSGKGESRSLRREGRVPAIAYGTDLDPTPVSVDSLDLFHALRTDAGLNAIINLDVGGETHLAMAREIQRHPVRRDVQHVDFVTVDRRVKVQVEVPIHLEGAEEAPGVEEGGVVEQSLYALQVEVLPLDVPSHIELDVSDMNVGDVKRVEDLPVAEGVEILDDPETTLVSVVVPQLEVPEPEEGEDVEVEGAEAEDGEETEASEESSTDEE